MNVVQMIPNSKATQASSTALAPAARQAPAEAQAPQLLPIVNLLAKAVPGIRPAQLGFGSDRALTTAEELSELIEHRRRPPRRPSGAEFSQFSFASDALGMRIADLARGHNPKRPASKDVLRRWRRYGYEAQKFDTLIEHAQRIGEFLPTYCFEGAGQADIYYNSAHISLGFHLLCGALPGMTVAPLRWVPKRHAERGIWKFRPGFLL